MPDFSFHFGHVHTHIPPDSISPGDFVSDFVHSLIPVDPIIPPNPVEPLGHFVSDFVHELHHPTTTLFDLGADHGFFIT